MRIAIYNQFFWPDQAATSQLATDLARQLVRDGHDVTVVCGAPGYAGNDAGVPPPVTMLNALNLSFSRGVAARMGSYVSFLGSAVWRTMTMERVDVVVTMTTPPLLSLLGNIAKLFRGAHHVVWEMDVYPEVAFDVGWIDRRSLTGRILAAIAHRSRRYADNVWVLGECMRRRIVSIGCDPDRVSVYENWSDSDLYRRLPNPRPGHLLLLYSGNLGLTHDVATLRDAMLELKHETSIRLQIAGGGPKRRALEAFVKAQSLPNIEFLPYCSKQELGRVLSTSDVGLVTLQDGCEGDVVPSKIYGLMACGRPILFVGPTASTPAWIIDRFQCGWRVNCGDVAGFIDTVRLLTARPDLVRAAGERARQAFLEHYERDMAVKRLGAVLNGYWASAPPNAASARTQSSSSTAAVARSRARGNKSTRGVAP